MSIIPFTEKIKKKKKLEFVRSGSTIPGSGSPDLDPHKNEADSKHWHLVYIAKLFFIKQAFDRLIMHNVHST